LFPREGPQRHIDGVATADTCARLPRNQATRSCKEGEGGGMASSYYPQESLSPEVASTRLRSPSIRVKLNPELTANESVNILEEPTISPYEFEAVRCEEEASIIQEHEKTLRSRVDMLLPEDKDCFQKLVDRYVNEGLDREAVVMAIAALKNDANHSTKVNSFVSNYNQLKGMGFAPHIICAALMKTDDKLEEAASLCLGVSSS